MTRAVSRWRGRGRCWPGWGARRCGWGGRGARCWARRRPCSWSPASTPGSRNVALFLAMDKLQTLKRCARAGAAAGRRGGAGPAQPGALLGRGQLPPRDRGVARHGQGQGADRVKYLDMSRYILSRYVCRRLCKRASLLAGVVAWAGLCGRRTAARAA